VLGLVVAYLMWPLVNRLDRKMPRWAAILVVYVIAALGIVLFFVFIVPPLLVQIQRLVLAIPHAEDWPHLAQDITKWYEATIPPDLQAPVSSLLRMLVPELQKNAGEIVRGAGGWLASRLAQVFSALAFVFGLLIIPIWLFYFLMDVRRAKTSLNRILDYRIRADFWNTWRLIDRSLSAYIRGQLTLGVIVGTAAGVGMAILDFLPGIEIDYILVLAIWAGFAELIPMIGAMLGAVPAVIVTLFVGGPVAALAVVALFFVIQFLENNILVPRIVGQSVGVHPAILMVSLVVFGAALGLIGVVLAAPITAILRDVYLYAYRRLSGNSAHEAFLKIKN
jgi:predicted PurR-regulated permease PerM